MASPPGVEYARAEEVRQLAQLAAAQLGDRDRDRYQVRADGPKVGAATRAT
jgi:hypothetical protein